MVGQEADELKSQMERRIFTHLLMKCQALDMRRNPERQVIISDFCRNAIRDSQYLVLDKLPDDIIQKIKEKKECQ